MVLLGLIVLTLTTHVLASPHGYGVKGGAVAKAEATATAGAFSGLPPLPLAIPSGAGYSGSFSKSSSSSFASSSASSSSSSFSFSGSGANAINGFGLNNGCSTGLCQNNGCSSGACQSNGSNDANLAPNNGQYGNAAQATAGAGAKVFVSSPYGSQQSNQPCLGANCNDESKKCVSGQCSNNNSPVNACANGDCSSSDGKLTSSTNCISGTCGQENTETTLGGTSSNDVKINIPGNSHHGLNLPSGYSDKAITNGDSNACFNGICKPASHTLNPSNNYGGNTIQPNKDLIGILPSSNDQNAPNYSKLSTLEPECTTHDCVSPSQSPSQDNEHRPSSYEVPIFGTTLPSNFDKKESCTSVGCQENDVQNSYSNNLPVSESPNECSGGVCTSIPPKGVSPKPLTPFYNVQSSEHPSPSIGSSDCKGPNCGTSANVGVHTNQPNYNSLENCGPAGCSNGAHASSTIPKNSYGYGSSEKPSSENYLSSTGYTDCKGLNCGTTGYPNPGINTIQPTYNTPGNCGSLGCGNTPQLSPSTGHSDCKGPSCIATSFPSVVSNTKLPSFTRPANCGPSGCGNIPQSGVAYQNQPGYENIGKVTPSDESSFAPSDYPKCKGDNCGTPSFPSAGAHVNQPAYNVPGNCGSSGCIPQTGTSSYNQQAYNQQGAISTSFDQGSQPSSPSWSTQSTISPRPSGGYTNPFLSQSYKHNPSISSPNTELAPPNENSGLGIHSKPFDISKPSTFNANQNTQVYTGGFGGSQGSLDQSVFIKPYTTPTVTPSSLAVTNPSSLPSITHPSPNTNIPSTSLNENSGHGLHPKPFEISTPGTPIENKPTQVYSGGFGGSQGGLDQSVFIKPHTTTTVAPSSLAVTNPSSLPSITHPSPNTNIPSTSLNENSGHELHPKPFEISTPSTPTENKPTQLYTGGFGGAQGSIDQSVAIKPFSKPTVTPVKVTTPSNLPSTPQYKPTNSVYGPHSQTPTQNKPSISVAQTSDTKDSNYHKETPYTGGFNAPSGFLKPNDYTIPSKIPLPKNAAPCASNNCGSQISHASSLANSIHSNTANANAHAVASAIAYTGGFGGPPGFLKPFDDGKNPGQGTYNGNHSPSVQGAQGGILGGSSHTNLGYNSNKQEEKGIPESGAGSLFNHAGAVAHASAVATASAGANAGSNGGGVKGCSKGCASGNGNGADGLDLFGNSINAGAVASAKSVAGAGSYGIGDSYSSSSASAHASAGAGIKGGYGRR